MFLPQKPVLPWKPIKWENLPELNWWEEMVLLSQRWGYFYPCKICGRCCKNMPLVQLIGETGYYMPKGKDDYCIMFDQKKHICKIYPQRPLECRLFLCKAPLSVLKRLHYLFIKYMKEIEPKMDFSLDKPKLK